MKLYKNTIIYSSILCCFAFPIAIVIEALNNDSHWLLFSQNLCIGTVCSAVVVIATTFLQYKIEKAKIIGEIGRLVHNLILKYIIATSPLDENEHLPQSYYKHMKDEIDNILTNLCETISQYNGFKRSNKTVIFNISKAAVLLRLNLITSDFPIILDDKSTTALHDMCNNAVTILNDGFYKKGIKKWLESGELL